MIRMGLVLSLALLAAACSSRGTSGDMSCDVDCWCPQLPLPTVTLSPTTTLDFGSEPVGSSTTGTLTVTNSGAMPTAILDGVITVSRGDAFSFTGTTRFPGASGTCSGQLAPGASCTVDFTYAPTDAGAHYSSLFAMSYAGGVVCGTGPGGGGGGPQIPIVGVTLTGTD